MDTARIGLAGEFYVLAQLAQRGYVATLTLGNTKQVDIVVYNRRKRRYWRVEVKTTQEGLKSELLFGKEKFHIWQLSDKHEKITDRDLVYCFVALSTADDLPKFFLVPSKVVAEYVAWQHKHWLNAPRSRAVKDNPMRRFRIEASDPRGYANNWKVFGAV